MTSLVSPRAMVVHSKHASVAHAAVVRPRRLEHLALLAEPHPAVLRTQAAWHIIESVDLPTACRQLAQALVEDETQNGRQTRTAPLA